MLIRCLGHAKFLLEFSRLRIVTDPFDAGTGYPVNPVSAELVLVSHHHHDHDAVDTVQGVRQVIDQPGVYTPAPGVTVTAVEAAHDDRGGALRGKTLLFIIEAEGLRVVHLGDLGHRLTEEQRRLVGAPDVLMIPVGGHYTIDAETAKQVCDDLGARIILPMHYRTSYNAGWPIAPVDDFLRLFPAAAETLTCLRVTKEDLPCQPHLAVLTI